MKWFFGIVAIALLLFVYRLTRRQNTASNVRPDERRKGSAPQDTTFHAVSLRFASSACDAAKAMEGRRFLSSAAPRIPLPECDVLDCKCRFIHHKDRRTGDDRRDVYGQGFGGSSTGSQPEEQRKRGERRDDSPDDYL